MKLYLQLDELRGRAWTPEEAFAYCADLATSHYENFIVGSLLMPRDIRPHLHAVYAFCRWADDLGDEVGDPALSLRLLEDFEREIGDCYSGNARHPVFRALSETVRRFDIPPDPFHHLIRAFKRDQTQTRYATFTDLLHYCRDSANPVGHLFLHLFGYRDPERQRLSDETCTGLQLANHWQDVSVDIVKGRIYLPQEDLDRFAVPENVIQSTRSTKAFLDLMKFEVERAREFFDRGAALTPTIQGRFRVDVELFRLGGLGILDEIERLGFDVLKSRPKVSKTRQMALLIKSLLRCRIFPSM
ncbi:MAG: squalene synthase HpnC [Candidatus Hydrogenedentota bacterium]